MFKNISRKLMALIGSFLPIAAFADSGPFSPVSGDISVKILDQIFGGLVNGGNDAFSGAISTFNGAVLIVGGILATYTLLAGTLGTAHDGEMLGKKFSSVWIPIRYALGTALVLPVIGNGYCIMQQLVMWCILQGVGLADAVWNSYNPTQITPPVTLTSVQKSQVLTFAENIAMAQICTQANAAVLNDDGTAGGLIDKAVKAVSSEYKFGVETSSDGQQIMLGDQSDPEKTTSCGKIILPQIKSQTQNVVGNNYNTGKLGDISSAFKVIEPTEVYKIHAEQTQNLVSKLGTLANAAVVAKQPLKISDVKTASDEYIKNLETGAQTYASSNASPFAQIKANSSSQGWILAGAWFTNLATANQKLSDAVGSLPTASYTWQLGSGFKFLSSIQPMIGAARKEVVQALNLPNIDSGNDEKDDSKGKNSQSSGWWSGLVQGVINVFTGLDLENLGKMDKPAILTLQDAGNRMMSAWAWSLTAITAVAAILSVEVLGNSINITPAILTLLGFAFIPISALVALGFTLAYLLPNLPFLMWIGIVLGWIIMCIEAILAAPLWAVMHLHPNGDDLTGRGGNGYMLLLGLLLRPALTIFGLIAALTLTDLMGEFVNKIFFSVFITGSGNGLITILSVVFGMSVYTSAMVQLFRKTFSLMHVIPDQLMKWIGGGQEQMGQYAGGLAEAGQKGVQSAAAGGSFMGEKAIQTSGQAMGQYLSLKNRKEGQANKNEQTNQSLEQAGGFTDGEKADSELMQSFSDFQNLQNSSERIIGTTSKKQQELDRDTSAVQNFAKARMENNNNKDFQGINANSALKNVMNSGVATINGEKRSWQEMPGNSNMEKKANFERAIGNSSEVQAGVALDKELEQKNAEDSQARSFSQALGNTNKDSSLGKVTNSKSPTNLESVNTKNVGNVNEKIFTSDNILKGNNDVNNNDVEQHLTDIQINAMTTTDIHGNYLNPAAAAAAAARFSPNRVGITSNASNALSSNSSLKVNSNLDSSTESFSTNPFSADQNSVVNHQNLDTSNGNFNGSNETNNE